LNIDNQLIVIKTPKNNKFLAVIDLHKEFTTNEGKFKFSQIKYIPSIVETSTGVNFKIYQPSYKEFVLLMKRGPQIIYPKDVAQIVLESNIHNSSKVLEIGSGSGALTLYLYTILKNTGVLYSLDSSKIKQVVSVLAKNDTWQIPTLTLYNNFAEKKYLSDEYAAMLELLPEDIKKLWKSRIEKSNSDLSDELKDYTKWSKSMVDFMHNQGITFMAGTDTPIGFLIPGLSLHQEIEALHNSGLSALEALQTATVNPARYFNLQDSLGRIKKNYIADLVILEANPLSDIRNTKKIKAVIKAGNYLDRNYLDSLVK